VILPAAVASGVQFPLLVNLVGRGRHGLGRQLGLVYATNTVGAIIGALLGGFVLLPALGAVGCWRLATALLVAVAVGALALSARDGARRPLVVQGAILALAVLLAFASGPTAAWRHGGIGAGRSLQLSTPAAAQEHRTAANRKLVWEAEGIESSVGLVKDNGLSFIFHGKPDGNVAVDAPVGLQRVAGIRRIVEQALAT